jgi:hypothetical protein
VSLRRLRAVMGVALTVVGVAAVAAEPSLEVHLDPRVFGIEDAARLVIRILEPSGTPVIDLGELHNIEVLSGPSTSTEFSWVNGAATRAVSYIYVIKGTEVGAAAVGPVTVKIGDSELLSEAVSVEVVPGSVVRQRPAQRRSAFPTDPFDDIFGRRQPTRSATVALRQLVNDRQIVLGQPVVATVVLDTTAGGVDGFEWVDAPSYPGWWAQRVEPPERITGEVVEVDGVRFNRFVVARHVLVPLSTGELSLPVVEARIGFRSGSLFTPQQVVDRGTKEHLVEVEERPRAPEGFSGAVGDLRYTVSLEPETIDFGEPAVLTIELGGNGNLPLVEAPALWPACAACETYPPEEESNVKVDATGVHGSRTWRMTLVPREWGRIDLDPVMLAVFDPAAGTYRKQTLGPLRLVVNAPPPTPAPSQTVEDTAQPSSASNEEAVPARPTDRSPPTWVWILGALAAGLLLGGVIPLVVIRRRRAVLPPRRPGESPAERSRELHVALERWWLDARVRARGRALEDEMKQLRRELEEVRFAPGRADHTETVADLEERVRGLMRRA